MKIDSNNNSLPPLSPAPGNFQAVRPEPRTRVASAGDSFAARQLDGLKEAVSNGPEVRPEAVEKGRKLAADPTYPPMDIIQGLARMFVSEIRSNAS
jgi:hypothetical protein